MHVVKHFFQHVAEVSAFPAENVGELNKIFGGNDAVLFMCVFIFGICKLTDCALYADIFVIEYRVLTHEEQLQRLFKYSEALKNEKKLYATKPQS